MKYINTIIVFLFALFIVSCETQEKESATDTSPKNPQEAIEIIDPSIETFINGVIEEEHFKGVVLVAKNNEVIHARGYGMANDTSANTILTKFHVASMTKQFTAAAIMQLLGQGKLNLKDPISNFLPNAYRTDNWRDVTIHHLLSHTSGIPDYGVTRDYYNVVNGFCLGNTVDGMIKEAMSKKLRFPPGTQFAYSNIGFTLLGQIISQTSGLPYHRYMKENVLEPIGMNDSYIHTADYVAASDEAIGYRWDYEHGYVLDDVVSLPVTQPDGNLVTTLFDFLKWSEIYVDNDDQVLQDSLVTKMTTPYVQKRNRKMELSTGSYGYGLTLDDGTISHGGYIVGFRSHFIVNPKENVRVVVFNNNVSSNPQSVSRGVYRMVRK